MYGVLRPNISEGWLSHTYLFLLALLARSERQIFFNRALMTMREQQGKILLGHQSAVTETANGT